MSERHKKKTEDCTFKIKTQKNEEICCFFQHQTQGVQKYERENFSS